MEVQIEIHVFILENVILLSDYDYETISSVLQITLPLRVLFITLYLAPFLGGGGAMSQQFADN